MANLRTNNLSGEQGKRAYRGSVFFDGRDDVTVLQVIQLGGNDDFTFGTGDFTIEMWINHGATGSYDLLYDGRRDASTDNAPMIYLVSGVVNYYTNDGSGAGNKITGTSTLSHNSWHHIAISRASGSTKLFVNGVQEGSTYSDSNSYVAKYNRPTIGGEGVDFANNPFGGHLSNLRVVKGTALYTDTFTPPQEELTIVDGTVLLCCQDSDNPLQEATGKELLGQGGVYHGRRFSNLAANGNLENGDTTNWVNGGLATFEVSTDHPHSGSYSLHCTSDGNGDACAYVIPVTLDTQKRYKISAYIKVVGPGGTSARAKMKIGSGTGGSDNYESRTVGQGYNGLGNWAYVEWIGLATSDTTHVTFNESSSNAVNDYFVDDLRIELWYPEEGENILANPNFDQYATGWSFSSTPSGEYTIGDGKLSVADNSRTADAFATQQLFNTSIAEGKYRATINYALSSGDFDLGIGNNRIFGVAGGGTYGGEGNTATATFEINAGNGNSNLRIVANQHCVGDFFNIHLTRVAEPKAPKIIPPYGVDAGNTFGGPIQQSTQGHMYFPSGRTEGERGRGRGIIHGGYNGPSSFGYNAALSAVEIASDGVASKFGDLFQTRYTVATVGSSTRSVFIGGGAPVTSPTPSPFYSVNTIDFVEIATKGNAQEFGDSDEPGYFKTGVSSSTRGVYTQGRIYNPSGGTGSAQMEFITIASKGNGQDFGNMVGGGRATLCNAAMSPTRGILAGGVESPVGSPTTFTNEIEFVTMATLGNSVEFGDLDKSGGGGRSNGNCSSNTRGVLNVGTQSPADGNVIEFITIASTGDAKNFGDLSGGQQMRGACSNQIRGLFAGGFVAPGSSNYVNTCERITIATTGSATDWGDPFETETGRAYNSGISDSHGGLS